MLQRVDLSASLLCGGVYCHVLSIYIYIYVYMYIYTLYSESLVMPSLKCVYIIYKECLVTLVMSSRTSSLVCQFGGPGCRR